MSFDGIFLHHMTAELQPLVGGRIQKLINLLTKNLF